MTLQPLNHVMVPKRYTPDVPRLRAEYVRWCGALHQAGAGHCGCKARQWFKCESCGRRYGWCVGGAPDPRCDVCVVTDPRKEQAA